MRARLLQRNSDGKTAGFQLLILKSSHTMANQMQGR